MNHYTHYTKKKKKSSNPYIYIYIYHQTHIAQKKKKKKHQQQQRRRRRRSRSGEEEEPVATAGSGGNMVERGVRGDRFDLWPHLKKIVCACVSSTGSISRDPYPVQYRSNSSILSHRFNLMA